jgi:hypothetical protein
MTNIHINKVDQIAEDKFFHIEVSHKGETQHEIVAVETLQELITQENVEVTYDNEFETEEEGETIEQAIDNAKLSRAEIDYIFEDEIYDIYYHEVRARHGEVTYDMGGEYIKTYKTEKAAVNNAKKLASTVYFSN